MASITLKTEKFVAGSAPSIYLRSQKSANLGQAPVGAAIAAATVQTDQSLTFTGLLDDTDYTVYLAGQYVDCRTGQPRVSATRFGVPQSIEDLRARNWAGGASYAESMRRADAAANLAALASGTLFLTGGGYLPTGSTVTRIGFVSGTTAAVTPTNQFFCIVNADTLAVLAKTADDGATAWGANALKELVLSAPLTVTDDTRIFIGCLVAAATPPTLTGAALFNAAVAGLAPVIAGTSTAGLTTPASLGAAAAAPAANVNFPYAYVR